MNSRCRCQGLTVAAEFVERQHTPLRSIRVPDATWHAAQAKAKDKGESVSDVVRRALERYAKRG